MAGFVVKGKWGLFLNMRGGWGSKAGARFFPERKEAEKVRDQILLTTNEKGVEVILHN